LGIVRNCEEGVLPDAPEISPGSPVMAPCPAAGIAGESLRPEPVRAAAADDSPARRRYPCRRAGRACAEQFGHDCPGRSRVEPCAARACRAPLCADRAEQQHRRSPNRRHGAGEDRSRYIRFTGDAARESDLGARGHDSGRHTRRARSGAGFWTAWLGNLVGQLGAVIRHRDHRAGGSCACVHGRVTTSHTGRYSDRACQLDADGRPSNHRHAAQRAGNHE
jgi:hypothetical protein